jgi:predicted small lipoprotein YifL
MKTIFRTMTVLALLMGISGCFFPVRDRGGDSRQHRYEQGYRGDQSGRDCWSRDGHWYCRDGN